MGVLDDQRQFSRWEIIRLAVGGFYLGSLWGASPTARSIAWLVWAGLWVWDWSGRSPDA